MIYPKAIATEGYKYGEIAIATRGFIVEIIIPVTPAKQMHKPFELSHRVTLFIMPAEDERETKSDMINA